MNSRSANAHLLWMIVSFALVGVAFIAATLYAQRTTFAIEAEVQHMSANALPSIERLTAARTSLRHLEVSADAYAEGDEALRATMHDKVVRARRELDSDLMAYLTLPAFVGERKNYEEVPGLLRELDAALDHLDGAMAAQDVPGARRAVDVDARGAIERLDAVLRRLISLNGSGANAAASRISEIRERSERIAIGLDMVCAVLAVVAAALAVRAVRRYTRLAKEHGDLLERRANELEIFAQRVAHDLLSPLSALSFCLSAVKRAGADDPKLRDALARGNACVTRSRRMVDAIFEFARSGAQPEPGARAEVRPVLDDALDELRALDDAERPNVVVEPFLPCAVACAPGVLTSILSNLLGNAVKHAKEGSAHAITVRVARANARARIEVQDSGLGLAPGLDPASVFEPYVRAVDGGRPGLGLGLATVKRFTESHGGAVGVVSVAGKGCVFWVELPLAAGDAASVVEVRVRDAVRA